MKLNKVLTFGVASLLLAGATSCVDSFLDKEPKSQVAPESYYKSDSQLDAILMDNYPNILPGHGSWYGFFEGDADTDNQIRNGASSIYTTDRWRTSNEDGSWEFYRIYFINYALSQAMPRFGSDLNGSQNTIEGSLPHIKHYLGEFFFLRAYLYFGKLRAFGDFPIVLEPLSTDKQALMEATQRRPRNEVARQIIADLDKAIQLMSAVDLSTTRINKSVALLLKSRVALYEATWLQNFKGTAFVPGTEEWPGKKFYPNYQFPAGSIDNEINYFLDEAMKSSKEVGDDFVGKLTTNTGKLQQKTTDPANPYYDMFAAENMSEYPEILLWRQYDRNELRHDICQQADKGNASLGVTRQYVQNFLMKDGTPVYTHGTYADGDGYYMGDRDIADVRINRDSRLSIFLKAPGDQNMLFDMGFNEAIYYPTEPIPAITNGTYGDGYPTGYALHKGGNLSRKYHVNQGCYTGCPIMRAAEALLNYMEASYLRKGTIDDTAKTYWQALRRRACVDEDFDKTIAMTDMAKEAENDWAAYSGGKLVDPTLYNIRRERRCEFLSEGRRWDDLKRWRSFDQLINTPAHLEGFHLWGTDMEAWYKDLRYDMGDNSNVSSPAKSEYIRPHERTPSQNGYNGLTWKMGHYLNPISTKQILLSAPDGTTAETSYIYQNPYWGISGSEPATK